MNLFNYFSKKSENLIDLNISKYRRSDCMNIALAARSYDQISDYFTSKNDLNNGYQIIKDGRIVPPKKDFPLSLKYIKHIRIGYTDWNESRAMTYINYLKTNFKFGFRELSIYTVTIGKIVSNANFFLNEPEILEFFENLNKEIKNDQNSSSKYSQELCNLVEQSEDDIYSKKEPSFLDY